ncbi:ubiquitin-protein ligase [Saccharomycopsis crataegensis]|uniref:RING-type E3 ubiquitin transferase n=1 Tax=Saccharomycopsis crataegensis TaxID=43959 RepID=A0AAV5QET1_9ASCO|nr:ubiquitin-protein ligase [Saccharomycopsis crataegensis]
MSRAVLAKALKKACGQSKAEPLVSKCLDETICSICSDIMVYPFNGACGHSACYSCLREWLSNNNSCPVCREVITVKPTINLNLKAIGASILDTCQKQAPDTRTSIKKHVDESKKVYQKDFNDGNLFNKVFKSAKVNLEEGIPTCSECAWEDCNGRVCEGCGAVFVNYGEPHVVNTRTFGFGYDDDDDDEDDEDESQRSRGHHSDEFSAVEKEAQEILDAETEWSENENGGEQLEDDWLNEDDEAEFEEPDDLDYNYFSECICDPGSISDIYMLRFFLGNTSDKISELKDMLYDLNDEVIYGELDALKEMRVISSCLKYLRNQMKLLNKRHFALMLVKQGVFDSDSDEESRGGPRIYHVGGLGQNFEFSL